MMDYSALTTTIVAGVLALALVVGTVVLVLAGKAVPGEFPAMLQVAFGAAIGGSVVARKGA
jgi:hypothetical protein